MIIQSQLTMTVVGKRAEQGKKDPSKTNLYLAVVNENGEAENFYVSQNIFDLAEPMQQYIFNFAYNTQYRSMQIISIVD